MFHFSTKSKWFEIQRIYFVQVILSPLEWVKCPFFINTHVKKKCHFVENFLLPWIIKCFHCMVYPTIFLTSSNLQVWGKVPLGFFFIFHTPVKYFKVLIYMKWIPVYLQNAVLSSVSTASISMCLIPPKS